MIGWYVHHQGRGHLHRAQVLARQLTRRTRWPVTGLSTHERPSSWDGEWVHLADDAGQEPLDPDASGRLHWVPLGHEGLTRRAAQLSAWLAATRPRTLVVDVSVEVCLLARLHGVPVVSFVLPGHRGDPAHALGLDVAAGLVAAWPEGLADSAPALLTGLEERHRARLVELGGVSRLRPRVPPRRPTGRAVVLQGRGGAPLTTATAEELDRRIPPWRWTVVGGSGAWWGDDDALAAVLADADVVVTQAGQGSVADVATARTPAVVVPAERPFDEQRATATALGQGAWPVVVAEADAALTPGVVRRAAALPGAAWAGWCAPDPGERLTALLRDVMAPLDRRGDQRGAGRVAPVAPGVDEATA